MEMRISRDFPECFFDQFRLICFNEKMKADCRAPDGARKDEARI